MRFPIVLVRIISLVVLAAAAFGGAALAAGPVLAGGNGAQTFTENFHREEGVFYDTGLCGESGVAWEISEIGTGVFHVTELANGTYHLTGTFLGKVTIRAIDSDLVEGPDGFVPENPNYGYLDGYPTYTGRYTQWFGENGNRQNGASTFTFNVKLIGSDGSRIQVHSAAHFNATPGGVEHEFEIERCS